MSYRSNSLAGVVALCLAALPFQPVWSAGGGGGGGASMPSSSAQQHDPVAEYRKGAEAYQAMLDRLDYLETREAIRSGLQEVQEGKTVAALPALAELQKKLKKESS